MASTRAKQLRKNLTEAEKRLWHHLRQRHLSGCRFRRQAPIGRFIVDFACHERKIIIEVDGGQHGLPGNGDDERDHWLTARGYRVLRYWNNDVLDNTEGVLEAISAALSETAEK